MPAKPTWKELLARSEPLILPCAHDALSARLIERAGFAAYTVGGYALVGARHALPDIGLVAFGEMSAGIRDIMAASSLPVLVDAAMMSRMPALISPNATSPISGSAWRAPTSA